MRKAKSNASKSTIKFIPITRDLVERDMLGRSWVQQYRSFVDGEQTRVLINMIGEERVARLLCVYRTIHSLQKTERIAHAHSKQKFPQKKIDEIKKQLQNLRSNNFLFDDDIDFILGVLTEKIKSSHSGRKLHRMDFMEKIRRRVNQTNPPDCALNILIYCLRENTAAFSPSGKQAKWPIIMDFLSEQEIININFEDIRESKDLAKRYNRNKQTIHSTYRSFQDLWIAPFKERYEAKKAFEWEREGYQNYLWQRDFLLPPLKELLPKKRTYLPE